MNLRGRVVTLSVIFGAAALLGAAYSLWPAAFPDATERTEAAVAVAIEAAIALLAAASLWAGSRWMPRSRRIAWKLLAAGVASWGIGSLLWLAYVVADRNPPFPGPVDVFYLAMVPLVAAGLAVHPTPRRRDRFLRSLVDGLLVGTSLLLIVWVVGLRIVTGSGVSSSPAETVVNLLYPITDTLLVVMVLAVFLTVGRRARMPLGLFALGIAFVAISDLSFFVLSAAGTWDEAPLVLDSGWVIGFVVIAGAGWELANSQHRRSTRSTDGLEPVLAMVPSWLGGVALLFGLVDMALHLSDVDYTVPMMIAVTGLLLLRQTLSVTQNRQLAARLARSVERLADEASHDRLTGLRNRIGLSHRLATRRRSAQGELAVLFIDIDHLKTVNDSLGHEVGDRLIAQVAEQLAAQLGRDAVTRFGGDEFVSTVEGADVAQVCSAAADIIAPQGSAPDSSLPVVPSMSAGLALWEDGLATDEVMRRADTALYRAKQSGRRRVVLYDPSFDQSTLRRVALEPEISRAIEEKELVVHYQPVFDLRSGRLLGAEALVRWIHPTEGLITPEEFLGHADAIGVLEQIGDFVLDTAVRDFAGLNRRSGKAPLTVSVNMSASELAGAGAVRRVHDALSRHGLDPEELAIEITEDVVVDDTTRRTIDQLLDLGVAISIDDFGTGNSSLRQLGSYPATTLKVDRSFVDGLGRDPEDTFVVRAILNLARNLGLGTVAEGVENDTQFAVLQELGCDAAQGWYFDHAQPFEQLLAGHLGSGPDAGM